MQFRKRIQWFPCCSRQRNKESENELIETQTRPKWRKSRWEHQQRRKKSTIIEEENTDSMTSNHKRNLDSIECKILVWITMVHSGLIGWSRVCFGKFHVPLPKSDVGIQSLLWEVSRPIAQIRWIWLSSRGHIQKYSSFGSYRIHSGCRHVFTRHS